MIPTNKFIKVALVQHRLDLQKVDENNINDHIQNLEIYQGKITAILEQLNETEHQFLVFPEYSFHASLENNFQSFAVENNTIVISGSYINPETKTPQLNIYFPDGQNQIVNKYGLSPQESQFFHNIQINGHDSIPNIFSYTFENLDIKVNFLVLICYDFYDIGYRYYGTLDHDDSKNLNLVIVPSLNPALSRFYSEFDSFVLKNPTFCLYSNTSNHGGSAIFGIHERTVQSSHIQSGFIHEISDVVSFTSNTGNDNRCTYDSLICNLPPDDEKIISASIDINRPYLIRPNSIASNNLPNVNSIQFIEFN